MAKDNLKRMLELTNNMNKSNQKSTSQTSSKSVAKPRHITTAKELDEQVKKYDDMVFGRYVPTKEEKEQWDVSRGYAQLEEMANKDDFIAKVKNSRLPQGIIESMVRNPCNYTSDMIEQSKSGAEGQFIENLAEKLGVKEEEKPKNGLDAARRIQEQLSKKDNDDAEEETDSGKTVDYDKLRKMIGEVIDEKLSSINNTPKIKTMSMTDSGNFLFLDTDNNVYECVLKYKGKRKVKK